MQHEKRFSSESGNACQFRLLKRTTRGKRPALCRMTRTQEAFPAGAAARTARTAAAATACGNRATRKGPTPGRAPGRSAEPLSKKLSTRLNFPPFNRSRRACPATHLRWGLRGHACMYNIDRYLLVNKAILTRAVRACLRYGIAVKAVHIATRPAAGSAASGRRAIPSASVTASLECLQPVADGAAAGAAAVPRPAGMSLTLRLAAHGGQTLPTIPPLPQAWPTPPKRRGTRESPPPPRTPQR